MPVTKSVPGDGRSPEVELKSRLARRMRLLSRQFLSRSCISVLLPPQLLSRFRRQRLWSPKRGKKTHIREAEVKVRGQLRKTCRADDPSHRRRAQRSFSAEDDLRSDVRVRVCMFETLVGRGTIKWLFMFQRRVFTVSRGGEGGSFRRVVEHRET